MAVEMLRSKSWRREHREELTERERECLQLAAAGLTFRQIGAVLGISGETVGGHMQKIRQRFRVHSARAAVAVAIRRGWIR